MTEYKWSPLSILTLTVLLLLTSWGFSEKSTAKSLVVKPMAKTLVQAGCSHFAELQPSVISHEEEMLPQDCILWQQGQPLDWTDFRGIPGNEMDVDALSACGIVMTPKVISTRRLQFEVHCYFSPHDSWAKDWRVSTELLEHEQAHFDLGEIYARLLRQRLKESKLSRRNLDRQITKIYNNVFNEYHGMQKRYDRETEHSLDQKAQAKWEQMIASSLYNSGKHARFVFEVPLH